MAEVRVELLTGEQEGVAAGAGAGLHFAEGFVPPAVGGDGGAVGQQARAAQAVGVQVAGLASLGACDAVVAEEI